MFRRRFGGTATGRANFLVLLIVCLVQASSAHPQSEVTLEHALAKLLTNHRGPIYVAPFSGPEKNTTELGVWAAHHLAAEMAKAGATFVSDEVARKAVSDSLVTPGTLASHTGIAAWIGKEAGAKVVVTGHVQLRDEFVEINFAFHETAKFAVIGSATLKVPSNETHTQLAAKDIREQQSANAGQEGLSYADCVYCPRPEYDAEAYRARHTGTILIRVLISAEGRAMQLAIVKGLHPVWDRQSVRIVRQWRFRPSMQEGKAVTAWNTVEVGIRLD